MAQLIEDHFSLRTPIAEEADFDTIQSPTRDPPIHASKPNNGPWFTFNDIPKLK